MGDNFQGIRQHRFEIAEHETPKELARRHFLSTKAEQTIQYERNAIRAAMGIITST